MREYWLDVSEIPGEGREFVFDEPGLWAEAFKEFAMPCQAVAGKPLQAGFTVFAEGRGRLIRGKLSGLVRTVCDRCTEPFEVAVESEFEIFEELLSKGEESLEPGLLRERGKLIELAAGAMLWEQFVLAFPVKPLCSPDCPGLCPRCGKNLSEGPCKCGAAELDPRLAVLRNLKIS